MKQLAALGLALACAAPAARAARPMVTDDARIVDPKACQLETWVRRNAATTEFWALPACNPWGNLELTLGGARTRAEGSSRFTDAQVQVKTVVRALTEREWGLALAAGTVRHPARAENAGWPGDAYFYAPLSIPVRGDTWVAHLNAGAVRQRDSGRTLATWGFGHEVRLRQDLFFIPEIFRSDFGRPFYQVGLRHWLVPNAVQVDATVGDRVGGGDARWFSIGLRLLSPPFLP